VDVGLAVFPRPALEVVLDLGRFILRRLAVGEEYRLETATIRAFPESDGIELIFETETAKGPIRSLPDTAESNRRPRAEVTVKAPALDPSHLVGQRFSIPDAYDEQNDECIATIYYFEHAGLNQNEIEIRERDGDLFRVLWTATTLDVVHYDGSQPDTIVEIAGWFRFEGIEDIE
jgi:hypothetical protein